MTGKKTNMATGRVMLLSILSCAVPASLALAAHWSGGEAWGGLTVAAIASGAALIAADVAAVRRAGREIKSAEAANARLAERLQKTTAERDREHQLAMFEEKEKLRIKKQLTTNMNNELRTPVAAIQVCLETVLSHRELGDDRRKAFLQRAYDSSMRLRRLLTDVSTISRIEEQSESIRIEPIDVDEIIRSVIDEFKPQARSAGITVTADIPSKLRIMGNSFLVMSVFHNMMDNAIAYSKATEITIALEQDDIDMVTFSFSDNGVGVPPQHLAHLFERFYRVDKGLSRKNGGTGLGLSIVKNAVLFHGGQIKAENNHYGGLRYTFSFRKM